MRMPILVLLVALLCAAATLAQPVLPADGAFTLTLDKALADGAPLLLQVNARQGAGDTGWVLAAPAAYVFDHTVTVNGVSIEGDKLRGEMKIIMQPAPVELGVLPVPKGVACAFTLDVTAKKDVLQGAYTGTRDGVAVTGAVTGSWKAWPTPDAKPESMTTTGRPGKGQAWGYLGDGSAVIDAKPPTKLDAAKPAWKVALPAYGHATPIVVNEHVFVTCEPTAACPWPRLLCFDAKDGKELWRAELNHLPAVDFPAQTRAEAAQLWSTFWRKYYLAQGYRNQIRQDATKKDELQKKVDELGATGDISPNGYWNMRFVEYTKLNNKYEPYKKATLTMDTWSTMGNIGAWDVGEAFATPVSDGAYVYAVTATGGFSCFTLDGALRWVKHYPGAQGEYCRNGRSPIIYKDLLISDMTGMVRAIDCATGELKWSAPVDSETILTPAIARVGDTDILLCFNRKAFRLPDGKPLTVEGGSDFGATALVKSDEPDVVYFTGGGEHGGWLNKGNCPVPPPACVRFTLDGDRLVGTVLWSGINGKSSGECHTGLVYADGKLYHKSAGIIEALTGKVLKPGGKNMSRGPVATTGHLLYIATGHVYGARQETPNRDGRGTTQLHYSVCTLDGTFVADTAIPGYTYAHAFTLAGDCVYLRTSSELWCVK